MKTLKKKFVLVLTLVLSVLMGLFGSLILLNKKNTVYAADAIEPTVSKINLYRYENNYYTFYYQKVNSTDSFDNNLTYFSYDDESKSYEVVSDPNESDKLDYYIINVELIGLDENFRFTNQDKNPFLNENVKKNNQYLEVFVQDNEDDDNIFMLKNANIENVILDPNIHIKYNNMPFSPANLQKEEFMLIQFNSSSNATLMSLSVNIKLNDEQNINPLDVTTTSQTANYSQLFNLTNSGILDTTQQGGSGRTLNEFEAQGKYTFTFTYNLREDGIVTTGNVQTTSFYLLSENYYINPNYHGEENDNNILSRDNVINAEQVSNYNKVFSNNKNLNFDYTEPRLYHTERIDKGYYDGSFDEGYDGSFKSEQDYFYFNNSQTLDYDGEPTDLNNDNYLKYPTIKYDASRYNLSYTKTMYGITTFVTTSLDTSNVDAEPKLILYYENLSSSWTETLNVTKQNGGLENSLDQFIAEIEFNEIGKYVLSFSFVLNDEILNYDTTQKLHIDEQNWDLVHSYELSIFGYQLMHSEYKSKTGATEKEMKDVASRLYADVTNVNVDDDNNYEIKQNLTTINLADANPEFPVTIINNNIASTNQAPLFYRYFASLSSNINESYFYYYKLNNNTYNAQKNGNDYKFALTSNTRFTDNGLYIVCLTFNYQDYQYLNNSSATKGSDIKKTQIFIFEIQNIEPQVNFYKYTKIDKQNEEFNPYNTYELINDYYVITEDVNYYLDKTYYKKDDLLTGGYTKETVEINWQNALLNPFNVTPKITVYTQNFDEKNANDITSQFSQNDLENGKISVFNNGIYTIKIEYGPCTYAKDAQGNYKYIYSASITSTFIIDKEEIGEGENIVRFYENSSKKLSERIVDNILVNKSFAIAYGKIVSSTDSQIETTQRKRSGAKINVSYTFLPINITDQNLAALIKGEEIISNGAIISSKNENIAYNSNIVQRYFSNESNVLTNDGIYIFSFEDEAGNFAIRYITKDTSSPVLFQYLDNETDNNKLSLIPSSTSHIDNMVNIDTQIIWGAKKAIKIEQTDVLDELLEAGYNIYKDEQSSSYYLLVGIDNYNKINKSTLPLDEIPNSGITIYYYDERNNIYTANSAQNTSTDYSYTIKAKNGDNEILENEHLFRIRLYDELGNEFEGVVEMTFDKSLFKAHVSGIPSKNVQIISSNSTFDSEGNGAEERLNLYGVSNKQSISFSWLAGSGNFAVTNVECEFYPLTFELFDLNGNLNANYPYSYNYSEKFNLMADTTTEKVMSSMNGVIAESTRTKTYAINAKSDSRFNDLASMQGMYKIVRTYKEKGDNADKPYVFYIDRSNIVSFDEKIAGDNLQGGYIGNDIKVLFGDDADLYTFSGKDFLQQFINDYIFLTNKQPGTLSIPTNKYSYEDINNQFDTLNSRIGVNRLSFKIYRNGTRFEENNRISNQNLKENIYYFVDVDDYTRNDVTYYQVVIEDNAGTLLVFNLAVNLYVPQANFVENNDKSILTETQNNYICKNNTDVSLVWKVDETGLNAKIDENDITITQIFENGRRIILYSYRQGINLTGVQNLVNAEGSSRYINFENLSSVINKNIGNCRIEVTLNYLTQNPSYYGEYLSSTKVIYFDYEKPQFNFNNLFENDKYLSNLSVTKEEFEDYNSSINFENYAFVVDNDFTLKSPQKSDFWQQGLEGVTTNANDLEMVWYRKYDKYADDAGRNQQSIIPGDDRYNKTEDAPTRFNFNANLTIEGKKVYTEISTNIEKFTFDEIGYYEIIEKDCANNYRIYTIYVLSASDKKINYTETIDAIDGGDPIDNPNLFKVIENDNCNFEINNQKISIDSFDNLGTWFAISVSNGSNNTKLLDTLYISPINKTGYLTLEEALSQINNAILDTEHTGKYFVIKIVSSQYININLHFRTPGEKYELDAVITATNLTVTIDPDKYNGTYLKTLKVFEVDENGVKSTEPLATDSNGNEIEKGEFKPENGVVRYIFTYSVQKVRNLWFEYTDNFGISYKDNFILGITQTPFDEMLIFNNSFIKNDNFKAIKANDISTFDKFAEYYSNSQIVFEYQPIIYGNIQIYLDNNNDGSFSDDEIIEIEDDTNATRNVRRKFIPEVQELQDAHYLIVFEDTSGKHYQFSIHIYSKIAELHFIDDNNYEHYFDINSDLYEYSVSRVVYLSYQKFDTLTSYPIKTTASVTRSYRDSNNISVVKDYGVVENEFLFNEYGLYTVTATNELGATKTYSFELIKSDAIYYSVKANANGKTIFLSPSAVKYDYGQNQLLDHYVSIYPTTIDVNQEKNLRVEEDDLTKNKIVDTRIYHIYSISPSFNYDNKIAVTQISTNSNILQDRATITETKAINGSSQDITNSISSKYLKSNADKLILTMSSYFENQANLLKVKVVYENKDLGFVNEYDGDSTIQFELTTAGQYKIYVYDLAGNQQSFGGTEYLEISLINNFIYNLNGQRGIYNSIYNSSVSLFVEQRSNFITDSNGNAYTITCTLNGSNYSPSYLNNNYVFNDYGMYVVTLKGYLNKDINGNLTDEVITKIKFTILNPNEARLMHEYIGLNGYEVTKILKNNTDITDDIKEKLDVASINKFAISGLKDGIGGSGIYQITVTAMVDKIIGESQFTYSVWINDDSEVLIIPSIAEGSSTTKSITLKLNYNQIYSKIGECLLKVNGTVYATINSSTATDVATTITLSSNARLNVTLETLDGNTISSFVVTKVEPLNTVAIIVIVITSVVVAGLTITFILFRKKMRVR